MDPNPCASVPSPPFAAVRTLHEEALIKSERMGGPERNSEVGLFNRRIDFHLARKPFNGFSNGSGCGFKLVTLNPNSGIQQASGSGKKSERPEYLDSGIDPELELEITFRRIGAGLRNLGNTCFLNSVLQCLTYTEPLAAYLQSGRHQNSCRTSGFCALCAIQKHVSRALQATGRILEPKDLVSNLRCISRNFRNARQEDAHEYMVNLLESMHKCCIPSGVPSESPSAYEKSLVHKIFGGRLRSQVKCLQCSFCSNKFDPFLDLSLEISKADTLQKALHHFTAKEQLDGGAKQYQCQQCKQKVKALKQLTVYKAPLVLTVHLKRFGHLHGQKIDKKIAFGPTLDLKPFVSGPHGDLNYTLYGVLVHAGWSTHSGHYYCFVRTSSGMWYSLDDNQVVQVNERKVLEQKAYMLFYVRDKKTFCRKKSVDILQKENKIMNAIGKSAYSKISWDSSEKVSNGLTENKDASVSAASSLRDGQVGPVPRETPLEKIIVPNGNGKLAFNHLDCERNPHSESSPGIPAKHDSHAPSINNVGHQAVSSSTIVVSNGNSASETGDCTNSVNAQAQNLSVLVAFPGCSAPKDLHQEKDTSDFVAMPSTCAGDRAKESLSEPVEQVQSSKAPCTSFGDTCIINDSNYKMCGGKAMSMGTNVEASGQFNSEKLSNQSRAADNLVGGVGQKSDDAAGEETHALEVIAKNHQPQLKVKRKIFKRRAATMLLSSIIIFSAAYSVGRKKNKPRKQHSMRKVSHNLKQKSCGNDLPLNTRLSHSDYSLSLLTNHFTRMEKKVKHLPDGEDQKVNPKSLSSNGSTSSDVINNDFEERVVLSGVTLASNNQQCPDNSGECRRVSRQNVMMNMLTQGLEETTVACWDDMDVSVSEKTETRAPKTAQIGYIGDEWDEEYDKGKHKKLRKSKLTFGGLNLFQEVASRNSKRKRAKLERSSLDNPPFRI